MELTWELPLSPSGVEVKLGDEMVTRFTDIDHDVHRAWVAADPAVQSEVGSDEGLGFAVARLFRDPDDPKVAEATVAVTDDYQRRGVGWLLLSLLISTAASTGVERLRFETLWENKGLRKLMGALGAEIDNERSEGEVLVYEIPIDDTQADVTAGALYELLRWIADGSPLEN